jgi:hypothetical protein
MPEFPDFPDDATSMEYPGVSITSNEAPTPFAQPRFILSSNCSGFDGGLPNFNIPSGFPPFQPFAQPTVASDDD